MPWPTITAPEGGDPSIGNLARPLKLREIRDLDGPKVAILLRVMLEVLTETDPVKLAAARTLLASIRESFA